MRIKQILDQHRNDFTAIMECEHCGATQKLSGGYHDANYHFNVIPSIACQTCQKKSALHLTDRVKDLIDTHLQAWLKRVTTLPGDPNDPS